MKKDIDILIFGNLCSLDFALASSLRNSNLNIALAVKEIDNRQQTLSTELLKKNKENIVTVSNKFQLLKLCMRSKMIITVTGSLGFYMNWLWLLSFIIMPPTINIVTGSDFSELLESKGLLGKFYNIFCKTIKLNLIYPQPAVLRNSIKNNILNSEFFLFPYSLPPKLNISPPTDGITYIFSPSRVSFKDKGTDLFLKAIFKLIDNGYNIKCTIVEHGTDCENVKKLIAQEDKELFFNWKEHLSHDELNVMMHKSHVIIDQFNLAWHGVLAIDAMATGKPVIGYISKNSFLTYGSKFPMLNCRTDDQIYDALVNCIDHKFAQDIGLQSSLWVKENVIDMPIAKLEYYFSKFTRTFSKRFDYY